MRGGAIRRAARNDSVIAFASARNCCRDAVPVLQYVQNRLNTTDKSLNGN